MTVTAEPTSTGVPQGPDRSQRRRVLVAAIAVVAAAGLGVGLGVSVGGSSTSSPSGASLRYYQSVMGPYSGGSMMGGGSMISAGSMMGQSGYRWMMGGSQAPGWMAGSNLPSYMMGSASDPGEVMGSLFADAPGPRLSPGDVARLAAQVPSGAIVDHAAKQISFTGSSVAFAVVASPTGADDMFEVAGMVNPTIAVPAGSRVSMQVVNADATSAHGLVVTAGSSNTWMPMMSSRPAFTGAASWFLGDTTSAGAHTTTINFTAAAAGTYQYLCPVPGHAQKGMIGVFVVKAS
jgi:rusticyanin